MAKRAATTKRTTQASERTQKLSGRTPGVSLQSPIVADYFSTRPTRGSRKISQVESLSLSGIFSAVKTLSQVIGMLPLNTFRLQDNGAKKPAIDHPAYKLLRTRPNSWMTASTFRRSIEVCRLLWGYGVAEITWRYDGQPGELWPLAPWIWKPALSADGDFVLKNRITQQEIRKEDFLYFPNFTFDGVAGHCFLDFASQSLGLDLDAQEFAAGFFANGAQPGGLLIHESSPNEKQREELRDGWEKKHQGPKNTNRVGLLWGGWKYDRAAGSMEPEKAQLMDLRRFGIEEAARWLDMPPHMLRDLSHAHFANMEESQIEAVVYSFMPNLVAYEQEYDHKLFGDEPGLFTKHNIGGLLRGNTAARTQFYKELFQIGGITINRICELEDEDPVGPMGDLRFVPLNMQTLEQAFAASRKPASPAPAPGQPTEPSSKTPATKQPALAAWTLAVLRRLQTKETNALRRAARRPEQFLAWLDDFCPKHQAVLTSGLREIADACPGHDLDPEGLAAAYVAGSRDDLAKLCDQATLKLFPAALETLLERWPHRLQAHVQTFLGETDADPSS